MTPSSPVAFFFVAMLSLLPGCHKECTSEYRTFSLKVSKDVPGVPFDGNATLTIKTCIVSNGIHESCEQETTKKGPVGDGNISSMLKVTLSANANGELHLEGTMGVGEDQSPVTIFITDDAGHSATLAQQVHWKEDADECHLHPEKLEL